MHTLVVGAAFLLMLFVYMYPCRAKHPTKVHVWAGISFRGATGICIFEGKMNAVLYTNILEGTLLSFIDERAQVHAGQ
jgi:hypothetical protein